jgi:hypothetical protein
MLNVTVVATPHELGALLPLSLSVFSTGFLFPCRTCWFFNLSTLHIHASSLDRRLIFRDSLIGFENKKLFTRLLDEGDPTSD